MRSLTPLALLALAVGFAPLAKASCEYPPDFKVPDGKSATQEEITAASTVVKKYLADMETYTACLDTEAAALPVEQQTEEAKSLRVKRYNAAVDAMEAAASAFNEQLRAFKAAKK
ncbi:MAG: hypothetical protein ABI661_08850 [Gammaproteobacteria bacterium]